MHTNINTCAGTRSIMTAVPCGKSSASLRRHVSLLELHRFRWEMFRNSERAKCQQNYCNSLMFTVHTGVSCISTLCCNLSQTVTPASWPTRVFVSLLLNLSSVLGSHDERNTEVLFHRVGVQLEGWEASEETQLLAGCRPYSEGSSYNRTPHLAAL